MSFDVMRFLTEVKTECDNGNWVKAVRLCKELWSRPNGMVEISRYIGLQKATFTHLYLIPGDEGLMLGIWEGVCAHIFNFERSYENIISLEDNKNKSGELIERKIIKPISPISFYKIEFAMKENGILDQFLEELYLKERWEELKDEKLNELVNSVCNSLTFEIKREIKKQNNIKLYTVDTSPLESRILEEVPFIVVNTFGLDDDSITEVYNNIDEILYNLNLKEYLAFILVIGNSFKLKELAKKSIFFDLIILDEDETNRLIAGKVVRDNLKKLVGIISSQRSISVISPYQTEAPVRGSMFYGRENELRTTIRDTANCFAIISARRMGKTSLLYAILDYLKKNSTYKPFFIDCSTHTNMEDFMRDVVERLQAREVWRINIQTFPNFLKRICIGRYDKKAVFLLDEVDNLIAYDREHNWEILKLWRFLFQGGYCRFIISGFRELLKEKADFGSELFRFMKPITIYGLDNESAKRLIIEPMGRLGIKFKEEDEIVKRIMKETANHPYLIQCYGDRLIHLLDKKKKTEITVEDVEETCQEDEIKESILKGFLSSTDNYERIIIYVWIKYEWEGNIDIQEKLQERGINLSCNINEKLKNLAIANIIYKEGSEYKIFPSLYNILKGYDLESLIKEELRKVK